MRFLNYRSMRFFLSFLLSLQFKCYPSLTAKMQWLLMIISANRSIFDHRIAQYITNKPTIVIQLSLIYIPIYKLLLPSTYTMSVSSNLSSLLLSLETRLKIIFSLSPYFFLLLLLLLTSLLSSSDPSTASLIRTQTTLTSLRDYLEQLVIQGTVSAQQYQSVLNHPFFTQSPPSTQLPSTLQIVSDVYQQLAYSAKLFLANQPSTQFRLTHPFLLPTPVTPAPNQRAPIQPSGPVPPPGPKRPTCPPKQPQSARAQPPQENGPVPKRFPRPPIKH